MSLIKSLAGGHSAARAPPPRFPPPSHHIRTRLPELDGDRLAPVDVVLDEEDGHAAKVDGALVRTPRRRRGQQDVGNREPHGEGDPTARTRAVRRQVAHQRSRRAGVAEVISEAVGTARARASCPWRPRPVAPRRGVVQLGDEVDRRTLDAQLLGQDAREVEQVVPRSRPPLRLRAPWSRLCARGHAVPSRRGTGSTRRRARSPPRAGHRRSPRPAPRSGRCRIRICSPSVSPFVRSLVVRGRPHGASIE